MKPIRLVLDGFLSYGEKQEIDFSKLTETGIFLIHGETGAGKSSIIDGIIFALYGKIPRFRRESKRDFFINYRKGKCLVEFEFSIRNSNGEYKTYKVIRTLPKGKSEIVEIWEGNKRKIGGKSQIDDYIEKIIGLPYDSFTRTIVLPQGKFADFILSTPSQKSQIIMQIAGIEEVFESIRERASEKYRELKTQYEILKGKLKELETISEKSIEEKEVEIKKIESEIKANENKMKEIERNIEDINNILNEFESIIRDIERIENLKDEIRKIENHIRLRKEEIKKYKEDIREIEHKLAILKGVSDKLEELNASEILSILGKINISAFRIKTEELQETKRKLSEKIKFKNGVLEEIRAKEEKLRKINQELSNLPPKEVLQRVKEKVENLIELRKRREDIRKDISKLEKKEEEIQKELKSLDQEEEKLSVLLNNLEKELEDLEEKIENEKIKNISGEIRKKLKEGDICPVCGNRFSGKISEISSEKSILDELQKVYDDTKKKLEDVKGKLQRIFGNKEAKKREIERINKDIEEKINELKITEKKEDMICKEILSEKHDVGNIKSQIDYDPLEDIYFFKGKDKKGIVDIEERLIRYEKEYEKLSVDIDRMKQQTEEIEKDIKDIEYKAEKLENDISQELLEIRKSIKVAVENISTILGKIMEFLKSQEIELETNRKILSEIKEISILNEKVGSIINRFQENQKAVEILQVQENQKAIEILQEARDKFVQKFGDFTSKIQRSERKYSEELREKEKKTKDIENEISNQEGIMRKAREEIERLKLQVLEISKKYVQSKEIEDIKQKIIEKYNEYKSEREKISEEKSKVQDNLNLLREKKGAFEREKDEIRKKLEEKSETERKSEEISKEIEILQIITDDFSSKTTFSFKDYLTRKFIKKVVDYGGKILREISGDRYSFSMREDGDIVITDSYYSDRERPPQSLSGGEMFIVSLALSLALATKLAGNSKFECFFIDEGFGSLDQNSLEIVIEALEKIAGKGINLGLISHVESMKNIETFAKLYVTRDEKGFSKIFYGR